MNRMIPELKGQEKSTLFIIGNGFDKYHGLKTSYNDFREWLIKHNCNDFISDKDSQLANKHSKLFPFETFQFSNGFISDKDLHLKKIWKLKLYQLLK